MLRGEEGEEVGRVVEREERRRWEGLLRGEERRRWEGLLRGEEEVGRVVERRGGGGKGC